MRIMLRVVSYCYLTTQCSVEYRKYVIYSTFRWCTVIRFVSISSCVRFRHTTVKMSNLALMETKRITLWQSQKAIFPYSAKIKIFFRVCGKLVRSKAYEISSNYSIPHCSDWIWKAPIKDGDTFPFLCRESLQRIAAEEIPIGGSLGPP